MFQRTKLSVKLPFLSHTFPTPTIKTQAEAEKSVTEMAAMAAEEQAWSGAEKDVGCF